VLDGTGPEVRTVSRKVEFQIFFLDSLVCLYVDRILGFLFRFKTAQFLCCKIKIAADQSSAFHAVPVKPPPIDFTDRLDKTMNRDETMESEESSEYGGDDTLSERRYPIHDCCEFEDATALRVSSFSKWSVELRRIKIEKKNLKNCRHSNHLGIFSI
jgi:hypothetical protein